MTSDSNPYRAPLVAEPATKELGSKAPVPTEAKARRGASWLTAVLTSAGAVYGPYAAMTLYTQIYVSCDHCKEATRNLLVVAPGLLPVELAQRGIGIGRQADWIWFCFSGAVALGWVALLALVMRRWFWLGVAGATATLALGAFLATALLAMIRA